MDEPFGAIDPVTRTQLQDEFLRLQQTLRKTIVFVTHDIDEAVKMGDRIAILEVGGPARAVRHARPAARRSPANDFVADFVGRDRAVKRLRITPIDVHALHRPPTAGSAAEARAVLDTQPIVVVDGSGAGGRIEVLDRGNEGPLAVPVVAHDRPLQDALALMLEAHSSWVAVTERGRYVGLLGIDNLFNASDGRVRE